MEGRGVGRQGGGGDGGRGIGFGHGGVAEVVDQREFDLQANWVGPAVEPRLQQHSLEDFKASAYFFPVCPPILTSNSDCRYFPAHQCPPPRSWLSRSTHICMERPG